MFGPSCRATTGPVPMILKRGNDIRLFKISLSQPVLEISKGTRNNNYCTYFPRRTRRTSLITKPQGTMRQIPQINYHFTEPPKRFFVFMAWNNNDPWTSFQYPLFCNLLQKVMQAHNKYGVIMTWLVKTFCDCSSTFRSGNPYLGTLSGALDLGSRACICKWVALGFNSGKIEIR